MLLPSPATLILTRDEPARVRRGSGSGAFHRVRPGVFVDALTWVALSPWERYRLRVHAVLRTWTDPALCLESAAALTGMPTFGEPRHIHLLSPDGRSWRRDDVIVHAARDGRHMIRQDGVLASTVAETTVDLARVLPPAFALAVADASRRRGVLVDVSAGG